MSNILITIYDDIRITYIIVIEFDIFFIIINKLNTFYMNIFFICVFAVVFKPQACLNNDYTHAIIKEIL